VLFTEDGHIVAQKGKQVLRIPLAQVPITRQGQIGFQTENVLAAIAAAWAVGVPWDTIAHGVATFISDIQGVPGRFNVFDYRGATLIADYGHNPDAIAALVQAVDNMSAKKRMVVISGAGDRRDQDIRDQTKILGQAFDEVLLYQDACQRGREDGEVIALLREGLQGAARTTHVQDIQGEFNAIDTALARLSAGDLCLILIDQVEEALAYITEKVKAVS
jgi:cyanophycin synthetase